MGLLNTMDFRVPSQSPMRQATGDVSLMCGPRGQYTPIHSTVIHNILTSTACPCPHATKRYVKMSLNFKRGLKSVLKKYCIAGYFVRSNVTDVLGVCRCFTSNSP